ncbi:MAG: hypothetical protein JJV93_01530 [Alphaproteobacteria bacterium]|nr:hypothetical protein [Alphaproteobacteria bacterium]MBL0717929.1 hypothetical protein [Alphaproteobacteria bacterium]
MNGNYLKVIFILFLTSSCGISMQDNILMPIEKRIDNKTYHIKSLHKSVDDGIIEMTDRKPLSIIRGVQFERSEILEKQMSTAVNKWKKTGQKNVHLVVYHTGVFSTMWTDFVTEKFEAVGGTVIVDYRSSKYSTAETIIEIYDEIE